MEIEWKLLFRVEGSATLAATAAAAAATTITVTETATTQSSPLAHPLQSPPLFLSLLLLLLRLLSVLIITSRWRCLQSLIQLKLLFWIAIERPIYYHEQDATTPSNHECFNLESFRVSQNQEFLLEQGGRRVRIMSFLVCWGLFLDSIFVEATT